MLITGGAGFIGFALARYLRNQGARVTILDIKQSLPSYATPADKRTFSYVRGSVTSLSVVSSLIRRKKIQTIFHLAAEAIVGNALKNPVTALDTNVRGTWIVLESLRRNPGLKEVVVASSDKAYGSHEHLPYREDTKLAGSSPYDASKSAADLIAHMYAKTYGLPIAVARCGNVYGAGDLNWSRLVPEAFRSLAHGRTLQLRSGGKHTRDYVYIDDVVGAYALLAENIQKKKLFGEAFNFGTNTPISVRDALALIAHATGRPVPHIVLNTAFHEIYSQYLDSHKAQRILGWKPRVARSVGFRKTAAWYQDFFRSRAHPSNRRNQKK